jgi:hypothetical protein
MNTRQSWIMGAAIVIGCLILSLSSGARSSAEPKAAEKAPRWEYRAVYFYENGGQAEGATKELNRLAEEGWEYVGPVHNRPATNGNSCNSLVVFRRPKP